MLFRDRVTISQDISDDGDPQPNWAVLAVNVPANITSVNGGEVIRGKQIDEDTSFVVEMRFRSDITSEANILVETGPHTGKTLHVSSVTTSERRKPLRPLITMLNCKE